MYHVLHKLIERLINISILLGFLCGCLQLVRSTSVSVRVSSAIHKKIKNWNYVDRKNAFNLI